jgi:multidrug efflux pump subunit AcrA (membrane-fusion protein)
MNKMLRKVLVLPLIVVIALGLVIFKVKSKAPVEHEVLQFPAKTVEVVRLKPLPFRARAIAYGSVEPSVLLKAKAEVAGKISYIHPGLEKGGSLSKGTLVMRIEPTAYEFSLDQKKAALAGNQSSLTQLEAEEASTRSALRLAEKNLQVGEKELNRLLAIWDKKLIARSVVDAEEQKVLQLQQQIEDLQGKLASYESRKASSKAQIKQSESQLAQSEDTLGRTEIRLPFDARIGQVLVEEGEFTQVGGVLFEALGTHSVEINAQIPTRQLGPLLITAGTRAINMRQPEELQSRLSQMQLKAHVSLVGYDDNVPRWEGDLLRVGESIDPVRDTIGLVVAVEKPYDGVIPGKRPPLLKGMYAMVELYSPLQKMLVIPRRAMHQGRVYVANSENRLEIHEVTVLHKQGDLVVIEAGLNAGDRVIVTDVIPVMAGLPVVPIVAEEYERELAQEALSEDRFTALIDEAGVDSHQSMPSAATAEGGVE